MLVQLFIGKYGFPVYIKRKHHVLVLSFFFFFGSLREKRPKELLNVVLNVNEVAEKQLLICLKTYQRERREM